MIVEIVEHIKDKFPTRYRSIIIDEIVRVLSITHNNRGFDVRVFDVNISFMSTKYPGGAPFICDEKDVKIISVKVLFLRLDNNKKAEYRNIDTKHVGLQIFLPNKIKERRTKILSEIFDELPIPSKINGVLR